MTNLFETTAWTVGLGIVFQAANQREDWDFADAVRYELQHAVDTVLHLEACYDLEAQ